MMITLTRKLARATLSTLLVCSYACAGDAPGAPDGDDDMGDDMGDGTDPGDGGGDDTPEPLDATGMYRMDSRFDLVTSMPGTVGDVANVFIEMTDDPYDPATWLLDTLQDKWNGGWIEDLFESSRPFLDGVVHDVMMEHAPQLVQQLIDIGDGFGQVTRKFGISSTMQVAETGDGMAGIHTVDGYHFKIDNVDFAYSLAELGSDPVAVEGVAFGMTDDGHVSLSEHSLPLQYGGFLAMALEQVIIPMVNPNADSLAGLLHELIDCAPIGERVSEEVGYGSPDFYQGLCEMGLDAGANYVIDKLISIDEAAQVTLVISGAARAQDQDGDRKVDHLITGEWNGGIDYAGNRAELEHDASPFSAERM